MPISPGRIGYFCLCAIAFVCLNSPATARAEATPIHAIQINALDSSNPHRKLFGELTFQGGLILRSSNKHFGAMSGLRIRPNGSLYAVTDTGFWFRAKLQRDSNGAPANLVDGLMAPILNEQGRPFPDKWSIDAESLAFTQHAAYVGIEQNARILRFPFPGGAAEKVLNHRSKSIALTFPGEEIRGSYGLEALAANPRGAAGGDFLLALTEGSTNNNGMIRGFLIRGENVTELAVKSRGGFLITDAQFDQTGTLFLLERRYSLARGPEVRIRRIETTSGLVPGSVLDGEIIFKAGRSHQIDNMEGLTVFRSPAGKTSIGLISADNHWLLQRTLYLEFELTR